MRFILLCLLLLGLPAVADVYTYIDSEGNRVFTDQPKSHAKKVEIAPTNGMNQTAPPTVRLQPPVQPAIPLATYQLLRILVPEPDTTVQEGASGDLIVTLTSDPALMDGHSYRLLLDGKVAGSGRSPVFPLTNLDRGTHQLAAEIIDGEGRIVERTPSQPVHIIRVSLDSKRRVNPCKKDDYGVRPECPLKDKPKEDDDIPFVPFI
ncbi:MAG: DUF4124 domain-containing protein [Pseudomonas sp.]